MFLSLSNALVWHQTFHCVGRGNRLFVDPTTWNTRLRPTPSLTPVPNPGSVSAPFLDHSQPRLCYVWYAHTGFRLLGATVGQVMQLPYVSSLTLNELQHLIWLCLSATLQPCSTALQSSSTFVLAGLHNNLSWP